MAEHLIQRGNNRQVIFANDEDMRAYVTWLKQNGLSSLNLNTSCLAMRTSFLDLSVV
ncbi:hypothetical protein AALB_4219 [Agarivorans albus MKT 106]|uniref:Uncharacterized protein n=1 Tax=Agarivorans albus MKT 106 TaxID=1331007 RepID=R9PS03_AGAAL|nr:hypothetical protein AALB_4219 [Agarivorans albus MKT 106]